MAGVDFTLEDVKKETGGEPWATKEKFANEINPEDMADTAAVYLRAAGEAGDVHDLAEAADEVGESSGGIDGSYLLDAEGRLRFTDSQVDIDGFEPTLRALEQAMVRATDAVDEVTGYFETEKGLDARIASLAGLARTVAANLLEEVQAAMRPDNEIGVTVTFDNRDFFHRAEGGNGGYHITRLSEELNGHIYGHYFGLAVEAAEDTKSDIDDVIAKYRTDLAGYARDLMDDGYDVSAGPLDLWLTDEMAEWTLFTLYSTGDPEKQLLATEVLQGIVSGVYGTQGQPGEPVRDLTDAEVRYLRYLYGSGLLDYQSLRYGNWGLEPGQAGYRYAAVQRVANGALMLLNPEIGGLDPADPKNLEAARLRDTFHDYADRWVFQEPDTVQGRINREVDLKGFNITAALLAHANVPPGEALGKAMTNTAIALQLETEARPVVQEGHPDRPPVENTATNDLLRIVYLNDPDNGVVPVR